MAQPNRPTNPLKEREHRNLKSFVKLAPVDDAENSEKLPKLRFPRYVEKVYRVSSDKKAKVDLIVPVSKLQKDASQHTNAAVIVKKTGKIFVKRQAGSAFVAVNGNEVPEGTVFHQPLEFGSTVSLGHELYLVAETKDPYFKQPPSRSSSPLSSATCSSSEEEENENGEEDGSPEGESEEDRDIEREKVTQAAIITNFAYYDTRYGRGRATTDGLLKDLKLKVWKIFTGKPPGYDPKQIYPNFNKQKGFALIKQSQISRRTAIP